MASVEEVFADLGLADRVHLERFGPPPLDPAIDVGDGAVSFARSGVAAPSVGTVLETAEAAGLAPGLRLPPRHLRHLHHHQDLRRRSATSSPAQLSAADAEPIRLCVSVACGEVVVDL